MIDKFYIGAYWGSRPETLLEVIHKTVSTFGQLVSEDDQFSNWYEGANSRKKALEKKFIINKESCERLYLQGIKKDEINEKGYSLYGFSLGLWSGHPDNESSSISIYAGGKFNTLNVKNCCVINLPFEGEARDRLLHTSRIKNIMKIIIENWDPDWVVLTSKEFKKTLNVINEIGWVTYVKEFKQGSKLSNKIVYENNFCGGHLFYLNTSNDLAYDYNLINELSPLKKEIVSA